MPQHFQDGSLHWVLHSRIFLLKWSHFANFRENVATIQDSTEKLRQVDGVEREFGVKAQLSDVQPGSLCTAGFNMPCYRRFTDKIKKLGQSNVVLRLVSQVMAVLLMCIPHGKVCAMYSVLAVARQVTSQREEILMWFQSSASYVKEINILRIHIIIIIIIIYSIYIALYNALL